MVTLLSRNDGLLFGCKTESDVDSLPVSDSDMEAITGHKEPVHRGSFALVASTAEVYYFDGEWVRVGG